MALNSTGLTLTGERSTRNEPKTINAIGNYSSEPVEFSFISNSANKSENLEVGTLTAYIEGQGNFKPDRYGPMNELLKGIEIFVEQNGHRIELTHGMPIKNNAMWGIHADIKNLGLDVNPGSDVEAFIAKIDLSRFSKSKSIRFTPVDKVIVRLNDDFSLLKRHLFNLQGYSYSVGEKEKG